MKLKLTIAYDGRPFQGWQKQPNALTVQSSIEAALSAVAKQPVSIQGSGRTDAGVHASAQVAHFIMPQGLKMKPENWVPALNTKLPASIRIMNCEEVEEDFHARFSALEKIYTYQLYNGLILPPLMLGTVWHYNRELNIEKMEQALRLFEGTYDFRNLAALRGNESDLTDYTRTVFEVQLKCEGAMISLTYRGNGFLYKMVRILTGVVVEVGSGKSSLEDVKLLLDAATKPKKPPYCAPADGLTLQRVVYS
ncbi:tRNA pseudouridine(38-40) synthase TruA [Akkermansiaceae bacterium]|nr:tRNA pseudouridine(38-40) synthase TruA [Akkermansiaceae bacterium]